MRKLVFTVALALFMGSMATMAAALPASIPSSMFTPTSGCVCHSERVNEWQPSMHAKAITDPIFLVKLDEAVKADPSMGTFCTRCHTPIGVMAGEIDSSDTSGLSKAALEGVSCDFCHQVTGTEGELGNASAAVTPDGTKRAQFDDAVSPGHATAYSEFHKTAEFCGNCHNVNHPGNGTHLEATYSEWKASSYATEGIVCQDCHMTPGPGVTKPNPGKSASSGPNRPHIYTMTFAGGNGALGDAKLAEANLQAAATLDLEFDEMAAVGSEVSLRTTITNVGAGHYLPTGLTEIRQMWLEVKATDQAGNEVLSERRDFGTILEAADGSSPAEMWDAVKIKSDDRIPPNESTSNDYTFKMPEGPVTVTAALYYRSTPEDLAKAAGVDVPTTTMASSTKSVYNDENQKLAAQSSGEAPSEGSTGFPLWAVGLIAAAAVAVVGAFFYLRSRKR